MAHPGDDAEAIDLEEFKPEDCSKGHRQLDDIWDHFKKIRLTAEQYQKWHRWWNARCKACGTTLDGKPKVLKQHLVKCKKASMSTQQEAHAAQEQSGGADCKDTGSEGSNGSSGSISQSVDRVRVSAKQLRYWRTLLAVAFIMTGWSFATVENLHFVTFMKHVRPNFELPSKCSLPAAPANLLQNSVLRWCVHCRCF